MTNFEQISRAANALAKQGKTPTVALVKTKLSNKVPLPEIISTLKTWQFDPQAEKEQPVPTSTKEQTPTSQELHQAIELAIKPLINEIGSLKSQVQSLEAHIRKLVTKSK